jgi:flagellar hook-basal body complex protein FliE
MNPINDLGTRSRPLDVGPNRLRKPVGEGAFRQPAAPSGPRPVATTGFAETARGLIAEVDSAQKHADAQMTGLATGEVIDVHEVTVAVEEAQLAVSLMIEIRNRLVQAYQEVMRMPV